MNKQPSSLSIQLPDWLNEYKQPYQESHSLNDKMRFVIGAAQKNIERQSGGPFSAAVFEANSGKLLSLGVNLVTTQGLSILHAELVAISLAQKQLGTYDLSEADGPFELFTSTEPCAMCLGAIPWSGIRRVICASSGQDAQAIGFDEGEKPIDWKAGLNKRGIEVITGVCQQEAKAVLEYYASTNGSIYNGSQGKSQ